MPKHPLLDVDWNMNEITTYRDLKLRWKVWKRPGRHWRIARKWKSPRPQSRVGHPTVSRCTRGENYLVSRASENVLRNVTT